MLFEKHEKKIQAKIDISSATKLSKFNFHGSHVIGSHILAKYIGWTTDNLDNVIDNLAMIHGNYETDRLFIPSEYYERSITGKEYRNFEYAVTRQGLTLLIQAMQESANEVKHNLQIKQPRIAGGTVLKSVRVGNNSKNNKQYTTADTAGEANTFFLILLGALFFFVLFGQWFI